MRRTKREGTRSGWHWHAASAIAAVLWAAPVTAQTRFEWPDTAVQVARYTTVDQCLASTIRVRGGQERRDQVAFNRDTMPLNPHRALEPSPTPVPETAARCAARFAQPTVDLRDFVPFLRLYLAAGRDSDAAALVARRFAAVPAKAIAERAAIGDSAIKIYLEARPMRLDAAERVVLERVHGGADRIDQITIFANLMASARDVGDTARARRAARWVAAVADSLTTAERESEKFETREIRFVVHYAMTLLMGLPVMLDSLRHSTAALVALERSNWAQMFGERPEAMPFPLGERAPTITADYWFPSAAASVPRPTPGHVSLVVFLDHGSCIGTNQWSDVLEGCASRLAALRRLSERFPSLEITLVSRTSGSFLYLPPPSPAAEAELTRKFLEPYGVRGAVIAVSSTPFWRLPEPDARRIDKDVPNYTRYTFGKSWNPTDQTLLIDERGLIVTVQASNEPELTQFVSVLMHRQEGGPDHAEK